MTRLVEPFVVCVLFFWGFIMFNFPNSGNGFMNIRRSVISSFSFLFSSWSLRSLSSLFRLLFLSMIIVVSRVKISFFIFLILVSRFIIFSLESRNFLLKRWYIFRYEISFFLRSLYRFICHGLVLLPG